MGSSREKRIRTHSAGARISLDRAPISLLSRPAARSAIMHQMITSMRDQGVIISEAEMRYRRWLALSEADRPLSPVPQVNLFAPSRRPQTATASHTVHDGHIYIRHNKTSLLRNEIIPERKAETDYVLLARQKKNFDHHCRSHSATPIMTESLPQDQTVHEFLTGSRYNCARHIDSQSLHRLGVYVPRHNLGKSFINPAGILPSSHIKRGRMHRGSVVTPTITSLASVPLTFLLEQKDDQMSFSNSSLENVIDDDEPRDIIPPYRKVGVFVPPNISEWNDSTNKTRRIGVVVPPPIASWNDIGPGNLDHVPTNTPVHLAAIKLDDQKETSELELGPLTIAEEEDREEEKLCDEQLHVSIEAQELARDIVKKSLTSLSETSQENEEIIEKEASTINVHEKETQNEIPLEIKSDGSTIDIETTKSDVNVTKTSSTLFVDMSKLENNMVQ